MKAKLAAERVAGAGAETRKIASGSQIEVEQVDPAGVELVQRGHGATCSGRGRGPDGQSEDHGEVKKVSQLCLHVSKTFQNRIVSGST